MRRLFIDGVIENSIVLEGNNAYHLARVMRAKPGDRVVISDAKQQVAEMEITGFTEATVTLQLVEFLEDNTESGVHIVLAQCLPKGDKLELITQKATELGVNEIVPLSSKNCVVRYDVKKSGAKQEKWQKIANEAGKQCGRRVLPQVQSIMDIKDFLQQVAADRDSFPLMCYENEKQTGIKSALKELYFKLYSIDNSKHSARETVGDNARDDVRKNIKDNAWENGSVNAKKNTGNNAVENARVILIVGPEGGFAPEEAELASQLGIPSVSLGPRILRAETAAISAVTIVQYELGDLGGEQ